MRNARPRKVSERHLHVMFDELCRMRVVVWMSQDRRNGYTICTCDGRLLHAVGCREAVRVLASVHLSALAA